LPIKQFNKPQTGLVEATVCSVTGQLLTDACGNHQTTQFFLEGTQPKVMCELHSTRNEVKVVGVERLANEHILSGEKSAKINDKKQLTLDLSFLGKLEPESAKSKKTSSTKSTSSSAKKTSSNISNKDLNTWFEDDNSSDAVNETDGEEFNFLLE
jgi:penicillin-binding protein 1A